VKNNNLSDETLLEDSTKISAAAQEATSNLLSTKPRDKYVRVYQMLRDVFQLESSKSLKTVNKNIMLAFFF
jgi:hypothetical protein